MAHLKFHHIKKAAMALTIASGVLLGSCDKDDDNEMPQEANIAAIVSTNSNFSLLKTAVVHAGLADVLAGAGPFTVFAPNNAAFTAAGFDTEAKIKAVPAETLKRSCCSMSSLPK